MLARVRLEFEGKTMKIQPAWWVALAACGWILLYLGTTLAATPAGVALPLLAVLPALGTLLARDARAPVFCLAAGLVTVAHAILRLMAGAGATSPVFTVTYLVAAITVLAAGLVLRARSKAAGDAG